MPERLTILYTGAIKAGVHTTLKALDVSVPDCDEKVSCLEHRAHGEHIAALPPDYIEELALTLDRGGRTYALDLKAGHQQGTLAGVITTLLHVSPMIRREFEWLGLCDAIVFVVDSRSSWSRMSGTWLSHLRSDLVAAGRDPDRIPLVFQMNKRDFEDDRDPDQRAISIAELQERFRWPGATYIQSVAIRRIGVLEALGEVIDLLESRRV